MGDGFSEFLPGGGIAPSYVELYSASDESERARLLIDSNPFLKVGYIVAVHFPGNPGYENSTRILYDVIVPQEGEFGAGNNIYYNCRSAYLAGSTTDRDHIVYRTPSAFQGVIDDDFKKSTTTVLLLLANGNRATPYIIGVLENEFTEAPSKEDGHNRHFQFNGIDFLINKDGEAILTYIGKTLDENNKDAQPDPETTGTYIKLTKEGNVVIDNVKGEKITIDKANKRITVEARQMDEHVTEGDWTVDVQGNIHIQCSQNATLDAAGMTYIGATGASEPLVLGLVMAQAMSELMQIFITNAAQLTLPVIPGQSAILHPLIVAKLAQWSAKYAVPASPMLAKTKFTE